MAYSVGTTHVHLAAAGTTSAIDTTGADIIWIAISDYTGGVGVTLSDSPGNTYTALTAQSSGETRITLYYKQGPITSASHTFTTSGSSTFLGFTAFWASGSVASPLDQTTGATTAGATSLATGSVTPTNNNQIVVTAWAAGASGASPTVSGYTVIESINYGGGVNEGVGIAYLIQTTAGATNPTWNWTGSSVAAVTVGTFSSGGGGGGSSNWGPWVAGNHWNRLVQNVR